MLHLADEIVSIALVIFGWCNGRIVILIVLKFACCSGEKMKDAGADARVGKMMNVVSTYLRQWGEY